MFRRAHVLLVATAVTMALFAVAAAVYLGRPILDPDGSFLGPSYIRLPILVGAAMGIDLVPRAAWVGRLRPAAMWQAFKDRWRSHWTVPRIVLVVLGIISFYVVYVAYRNLKSSLPFLITAKYDHELELIDTALFFGHHPGVVLQGLFGGGPFAEVLDFVYLLFIPGVPVLVTVWMVWSKNLRFGYWFVCSQVIAWSLGTLSYYMLPTLGPGIAFPWLYPENDGTPTGALMDSLVNARHNVLWAGVVDAVNGVAGFASLHTGISLLWALMAQYTVVGRGWRPKVVHLVFWVYFGLVVLATMYFGWHNISDDVAGAAIALAAFYFGGRAAGHHFSDKAHQAETDAAEAVVVDRST